jgi:histidine decarboxylase
VRDVAALLPRALSPFEQYCAGSGFDASDAYVTTPYIGLGVAALPADCSEPNVLAQTVAFDRAESEAANLTQTNMVTVSSFNGTQGLLWGYDLVPQPLCPHPLLKDSPVYDLTPLFDATRALYGTVREKRFPIAPGQLLPCACKTLSQTGPCLLYGALAVAIAADRDVHADLFLEDLGTLTIEVGTDDGKRLQAQEGRIVQSLVDAAREIGDNLNVRYNRVLVGVRTLMVEPGEVGCVLAAVPYVRLARLAVPSDAPVRLAQMTLSEWEQEVGRAFLSTPSDAPVFSAALPLQIP